MNLVNLFGNKTKATEPEYFLAIEIHESLIKTALWEVVDGLPSIVNIGSYESWTDEESLINGVDLSLEQAVKVIKYQPRKVIFGLPDSWIEEGKIHSTKTKLVSRLIKELDLSPIGMVPINSAIAHYMKKLEGIPPTAILLEIYNTKVVVSVIEKGEITASEEAARSGDIAQDVEEGLTVIGSDQFPARFILTNGGALEEEEQRITSHPWQERLSFQHMPKVEVLPVDFSIRAVALTGGTEAVNYLTGSVNTDTDNETDTPMEESNIVIPEETPSSMSELGFSYEETDAPETISKADFEDQAPVIEGVSSAVEEPNSEPNFAFPVEDQPLAPAKTKIALHLPQIPKFSVPSFPKTKKPLLFLLVIPLLLAIGFVAYLLAGQAQIAIYFKPEKITRQFDIAIAETNIAGSTTLIAVKKTVSGSAKDSLETTGETITGEKAGGTITIANKSIAPIILKAGAVIVSENGKYSYTIADAVTVASKSADPLTFQETYGKATGVKVNAVKIGPDYNLSKNSTFSVDNYSKSVAYAVADTDFAGGTSRAVRAASKADMDKLYQLASDKIKAQVQEQLTAQSPGSKSLSISELTFTKKQFDHNAGEEAATLNLDLEGSLDILVYSDDSLFQLISNELKPSIPSGSEIFPGNTATKLETPVKKDNYYLVKANVETSLFPKVDEAKLKSFIKFKPAASIRPFFENIQGFDRLEIKLFPKVPLFTKFIPLNNISFQLIGL